MRRSRRPAVLDRAVHEGRVERLLLAECQSVGVPQRGPFRAAQELEVAAERKARRQRREVGDRAQAERTGPLAAHGERIGILEAERAEHGYAVASDGAPTAQISP